MKYVLSWTVTGNRTEETQARGFQVLSKWQPAEGVTFHQFLSTVDGRGGFAFVETDNPSLIARDTAIFAPWLDFQLTPVIDITEFAQVAADAIGFRQSIE